MSTRTGADVDSGVWLGAVDWGEHAAQVTSTPAVQARAQTERHNRGCRKPDTSALPHERGDSRIGRECLSVELKPRLGKVAQGAGTMRAEVHAPGLTLLGLA